MTIGYLIVSTSKQLLKNQQDEISRYAQENNLKIDQWIKLHFDEQITAADVAGVFHYNPDYLSQIFKAEWGMGLCEYINSVRIKEAKNLLLNSDAKIYQIAYQV